MKDLIICLIIMLIVIGGIGFTIYSEVLKVQAYKTIINKNEVVQEYFEENI